MDFAVLTSDIGTDSFGNAFFLFIVLAKDKMTKH